ncbi:MAG: hypothetical protein K0R87_1235 [Pseudonocardia sp.]|nr:hypothetical protein [Pseudonocardia sp.]
MRVTVEPEALAEWSAHARRTADRLAASLTALETGLAPLVRTWRGEAGEGFGRRRRQWHDAASGLLGTMAELIVLVETARGNFVGATTANAQIWPADPTVRLTSAGRRIDAEVVDLRAAVVALVGSADGLVAAWTALATGLAATAGMAGDDGPGAAFGTDLDRMALAAFQGWRATVLLLDGIAGGLAATGNNLVEAERASTPGRATADDVITARSVPVPPLRPPPAAAGDARGLHQARAFTRSALSDDPTSGLVGVLALTGTRIASACDGLAAATDHTRALMRDAAARVAGGEAWYHPVAATLDATITRGLAHRVAMGGDVALLELELSRIHADHVRAVQLVRAELAPEAVQRLARLATAVTPPVPVAASPCDVRAAGTAVPEAHREALIAEAQAAGHKMHPAEVLQIGRAPDGRVVWLERGDGNSGLSHILRAGRIANFADRGVPLPDIPGLALRAVTEGTQLGRVREGGVAYEVALSDGRRTPVVVVVGSNGYIVTARPLGSEDQVTP